MDLGHINIHHDSKEVQGAYDVFQIKMTNLNAYIIHSDSDKYIAPNVGNLIQKFGVDLDIKKRIQKVCCQVRR